MNDAKTVRFIWAGLEDERKRVVAADGLPEDDWVDVWWADDCEG